MTTFRVEYLPFYRQGRPDNDSTRPTVLVTVSPSSGHPGYYFATAPGAGCSKDFATEAAAARALVHDDLGDVVSMNREG